MRRIILLALIVCFGWSSTGNAQNPPQVLTGLHNMVDQYLTGIARGYWEARALRVSNLDTPAEVEGRQIFVRKNMWNYWEAF